MIGIVLVGAQAAGKEETGAFLDLFVNQINEGEVLVLLHDKDVSVPVKALQEAGLRDFSGNREIYREEEYVSLLSLTPAVTFQLKEKELTLEITADIHLFREAIRSYAPKPPAGIVYGKESSAFFNYALATSSLSNYAFNGEIGTSHHGHLLYSGFSRNLQGEWSRGISNYTIDHPDRLTRLQLGDAFGQSGELGGGKFIGGFHYSRNYSLNPYFYRFPSFNIQGTTLYPATADIYINNRHFQQETLSPGAFRFQNLPVTSGVGNARVVIRDVFGHQREITNPFYFDTGLLSKGLSEYNYDLGLVRDDTLSGNYGSWAFLGEHRIGLTSDFTGGGRLEAAPGKISGGPSFAVGLPLGHLEGAFSLSRGGNLSGQAASLAYSYAGRSLSLTTLVRSSSSYYSNLSLLPSLDRPLYEVDSSLGFALGSGLNFTLTRAYQSYRDQGKVEQLSLSGFFQINEPLGLLFTASRNTKALGSPTSNVFLGLNYVLGGNSTASISSENANGQSVVTEDLQKPLTLSNGVAYHFQRIDGNQHVTNAEVDYQGSKGVVGIISALTDQTQTFSLKGSGGVVAIGGDWFFSRAVDDGFALVRVPGMKGVEVSFNNQRITQTNAEGDAIIPNLISYYGNQVSISPKDIPLNYTFVTTEAVVAPPYRGGFTALFPVVRLQAILGKILLEEGGSSIVPVFGELTVKVLEHRFSSPIGHEGEFYFENLPSGDHPAILQFKDHVCNFTFHLPDSKETFVDLGVIRCAVPSQK